MIIGVPKEIKEEEYRVAITPMGVATLNQAGHQVLIQSTAGGGSGFADGEYVEAGASVLSSAEEVFTRAEMIYKVKEPLLNECLMLSQDQIVFTFLRLAAEERLTHLLIDKGVTSIAYEAIESSDGSLPLLTPMSQVAGKLAIQVAAHCLEKPNNGAGKLLSGVPGVPPCTVVIISGGVVGTNAAEIGLGIGAHVIIIDKNVKRLAYLDELLDHRIVTIISNPANIASAIKEADVLIGAVLVAGGRAPVLVTKEMVSSMKPGSVIVDVAVDQGGCVETTHSTSHMAPTYIVDDVVHYCVTNMPAIVPRTSTQALCNATLPYAMQIANLGLIKAIESDQALAKGVSTFKGLLTSLPVSESLGIPYVPLQEAINRHRGDSVVLR